MHPMQPLFNFQGSAALSILAFLGTAGLLGALGISFVILLARGSRFAARRVAMVGAGVAGAYLAALSAFSLATGAREVEPGNAKYFCEIDCHLAYSVVDARRLDSIGGARADGAWELVTVRVWFDPGTTSARRGDAPLTPNPRLARLVDAGGNAYAPSASGLRALEAERGEQVPLSRALRPGESYTTTLVFQVPAQVRAPELLLTENDPVTRLLIGHENSLLHHPIPFRLADSSITPNPWVRG
ncbi:MAG TPA: hypothetical protein VFJ16_30665 [Longimicrobium sp.]|nr:hypothetical protein [Longimicrobium sp.]